MVMARSGMARQDKTGSTKIRGVNLDALTGDRVASGHGACEFRRQPRVLDDTLRAKFQSWYPALFNVYNADHTEHDLAA